MTNYYTNSDYTIPRAKNDAVREALANEFLPSKNTNSDGVFRGFNFSINIDNNEIVDTNTIDFSSMTLEEKWDRYIEVFQMIPSSLALYRLICTYGSKLKISPSNGYKSVWAVELIHNQTGVKLLIGDSKAGFFVSVYTKNRDMDAQAFQVGKRFLSLLIDKNFTHSYDRTIAGSVA